MTRPRTFILAASWLALAGLLLAACDTGLAPGAGATLNLLAWGTAPGADAGLQALNTRYRQDHADVRIVNWADAAGASAASAALKDQLLGASAPPDVFQAPLGRELTDGYAAADLVAPLDDLYQSQGWTQVFPKGVLDILSGRGHYWSVPTGIRRSNMLWYNKQIFADAGLRPPTTWDAFYQAAATLSARNLEPLALGDKGGIGGADLFEMVLLGTLGAQDYRGLWTGATAWDDPRIAAALRTFQKVMGYANPDFTTLTWDEADDLLIAGKAGMAITGDWAAADFKAKQFSGYGWAPAPGTVGIYDASGDSYALPKSMSNRDLALAWLTLVGSQAGQDAFNPLAETVPVRTDANPAAYDAYVQAAMAEWKQDAIVPSLVHGAAAKLSWNLSYQTALNALVAGADVPTTQAALAQACVAADVCKTK